MSIRSTPPSGIPSASIFAPATTPAPLPPSTRCCGPWASPWWGGTGDGGRVSANGKVYHDAVAYALIKNQGGRVKAYKENIYHQMGDYRFIASGTDKANYIIGSLNGQPAKQVYQRILHVSEQEILTQTFKNPFGKINGEDTCIISIKRSEEHTSELQSPS